MSGKVAVGILRTPENFQGATHTYGASRGHLCDSSAFLYILSNAAMQCIGQTKLEHRIVVFRCIGSSKIGRKMHTYRSTGPTGEPPPASVCIHVFLALAYSPLSGRVRIRSDRAATARDTIDRK